MNKERFKHYLTGIDFIDEEHWEMFELLNKVEEFRKNDPEEAKKYLRLFKDVSHRHTEDEYHMMHQIGYPYAESHTREHNEKCLQVEAYLDDDYGMTKFNIRHLNISQLENYLADHIDQQDMQYVPFYERWSAQNALRNKHGI